MVLAHCYSGNDAETFVTTSNQLGTLKKDLYNLLTKSVNYEVKHMYHNGIGKFNEQQIMDCVHKTLKKEKLPMKSFHMDGGKMDEPIIAMYKDNPKVYQVLAKCGFLDLVGRIVATAAWATSAKAKDPQSLERFIQCIDKIDFTQIQIWKSISNPNGPVLTCVS